MILAIIQARLNSTRFPGKVLADLHGQSVLVHVVDRVREIRSVDRIVVATCRDGGETIKGHCESLGVHCSIEDGPENDVLGRFASYLDACPVKDSDLIVRVCADNPLLDPILADELIAEAVISEADYTGYELSPGPRWKESIPAITQPNGLVCEMMTVAALRQANAWLDPNAPEREHVTQVFYRHPELFCCAWLPMPEWWDGKSRAIDTPEDLERIAEEMIHAN